jgi:hypothetical protein
MNWVAIASDQKCEKGEQRKRSSQGMQCSLAHADNHIPSWRNQAIGPTENLADLGQLVQSRCFNSYPSSTSVSLMKSSETVKFRRKSAPKTPRHSTIASMADAG